MQWNDNCFLQIPLMKSVEDTFPEEAVSWQYNLLKTYQQPNNFSNKILASGISNDDHFEKLEIFFILKECLWISWEINDRVDAKISFENQ